MHYDGAKPPILLCDASPYGLGAVLSHVIGNSEERPIAYMSRTRSSAEQKYSQVEEGLAIIFGITWFHNYIFGRSFTIESDHQPLSFLFSENGFWTYPEMGLEVELLPVQHSLQGWKEYW